MTDHTRPSTTDQTTTEQTTTTDLTALTLQPTTPVDEKTDFTGFLKVTLTADVEVSVRATNLESARAMIAEQLTVRNSTASDELSERFTELIRKTTFDYTLHVEADTDPQDPAELPYF